MSSFKCFEFDAFAVKHLQEWFDYGCAPSGWDLGDLNEFSLWVEKNQDELAHDASWPSLARQFEKENSGRS